MYTSPDTQMRLDDRLIAIISRWLGRHIGNDELRRELDQLGTGGLGPGSAEAVGELSGRLRQAEPGERGELEMIARETLEALALGE